MGSLKQSDVTRVALNLQTWRSGGTGEIDRDGTLMKVYHLVGEKVPAIITDRTCSSMKQPWDTLIQIQIEFLIDNGEAVEKRKQSL